MFESVRAFAAKLSATARMRRSAASACGRHTLSTPAVARSGARIITAVISDGRTAGRST